MTTPRCSDGAAWTILAVLLAFLTALACDPAAPTDLDVPSGRASVTVDAGDVTVEVGNADQQALPEGTGTFSVVDEDAASNSPEGFVPPGEPGDVLPLEFEWNPATEDETLADRVLNITVSVPTSRVERFGDSLDRIWLGVQSAVGFSSRQRVFYRELNDTSFFSTRIAAEETVEGELDALRFVPLTAVEEKAGLLFYFSFNGTTRDLASLSPRGVGTVNDDLAAVNGPPQFAEGPQPGSLALLIPLDADPPPILVGDAASRDLFLGRNFTIGANVWIESLENVTAGRGMTILDYRALGASSYAFGITLRNPNFVSIILVGTGNNQRVAFRVAEGGNFPVQQWTHVAFVGDGTDIIAYLDGDEVGRNTYNQNDLSTREPTAFQVGFSGTPENPQTPLAGRLADVCLFDGALDPDEVGALADDTPAALGLSEGATRGVLEIDPLLHAVPSALELGPGSTATSTVAFSVTNRNGAPIAGASVGVTAPSEVSLGGDDVERDPSGTDRVVVLTDSRGRGEVVVGEEGVRGSFALHVEVLEDVSPSSDSAGTTLVNVGDDLDPSRSVLEKARHQVRGIPGPLQPYGPISVPEGAFIASSMSDGVFPPPPIPGPAGGGWVTAFDPQPSAADPHPSWYVVSNRDGTVVTVVQGVGPPRVILDGADTAHLLLPPCESLCPEPPCEVDGEGPANPDAWAIVVRDPVVLAGTRGRDKCAVRKFARKVFGVEEERLLSVEATGDPLEFDWNASVSSALDAVRAADAATLFLWIEIPATENIAPGAEGNLWDQLIRDLRGVEAGGTEVDVVVEGSHAGLALDALDGAGLRAEVVVSAGSSRVERELSGFLDALGDAVAANPTDEVSLGSALSAVVRDDVGLAASSPDSLPLEGRQPLRVEPEGIDRAGNPGDIVVSRPLDTEGRPVASGRPLALTVVAVDSEIARPVDPVHEIPAGENSTRVPIETGVEGSTRILVTARDGDREFAGVGRVEVGRAVWVAPRRIVVAVGESATLDAMRNGDSSLVMVPWGVDVRSDDESIARPDRGSVVFEPGRVRVPFRVEGRAEGTTLVRVIERGPRGAVETEIEVVVTANESLLRGNRSYGGNHESVVRYDFIDSTAEDCLDELLVVPVVDLRSEDGLNFELELLDYLSGLSLSASGEGSFAADGSATFAGEGTLRGEPVSISFEVSFSAAGDLVAQMALTKGDDETAIYDFLLERRREPARACSAEAVVSDLAEGELAQGVSCRDGDHVPADARELVGDVYRFVGADGLTSVFLDSSSEAGGGISAVVREGCAEQGPIVARLDSPWDDQVEFETSEGVEYFIVVGGASDRFCGSYGLSYAVENTPAGEDVVVEQEIARSGRMPVRVTVAFAEVTDPGATVIRTAPVEHSIGTGPYTLVSQSVVSVSTTATFSTAQVGFRFDPGSVGLPPATPPASISVLHSSNGSPWSQLANQNRSSPGAGLLAVGGTTSSFSLFALGYLTPEPEGPFFRRGDANVDGSVDISDAVATLGALFLGASQLVCEDGADTNDDGSVDISDAVATLGFLFTGGTTPRPPGPLDCGPDPTDDALDCVTSGACG